MRNTAETRKGHLSAAVICAGVLISGMASAAEGASSQSNTDTSVDSEPTVKEAPASRSAQAVYQEQHALFDRRLTIETGISYSRNDRKQLALNGFLALDSIFLGDISVDEVKADILTLDMLARWGLTPRLQVDFAAPLMYRHTVYQSTGTDGDTSVVTEESVTMDPEVEFGDVSLGLYYQLAQETPYRPDVVWNIRVKGPTGSHPYGIKSSVTSENNNLKVPERLPSGNGVWALSTGLSFVKTVDPAILFANIGLFYNFEESFDDISSIPGITVPGSVKLGDSFQYGLGTAFALNETTSLSLGFSHRLTARSRTKVEGGSWHDIVGSDGNAATLSLGLTHALNEKTSMVTSLGIGLTPDASDLTLSVKFPQTF